MSFNDRIDTLTLDVICDVVPTHVRAVIAEFSKHKTDRIFLDMFINEVFGKDNWNAVVDCYHSIVKKYDVVLSSLNDGTGYYNIG